MRLFHKGINSLNMKCQARSTRSPDLVRTRASTPARTSLPSKKQLHALIARTNRGLKSSPNLLHEIHACILDLEASQGEELLKEGSAERPASFQPTLSATWRLLWTTEKETLFILKNAGWFGTAAGEVFQVIDTNQNRLQNVITFPPEGCFVVDSDLQPAGPKRCDFKFRSATLKLPAGKNFGLPPFGEGWFDTVYLDEDMRVSKDSRGDTLVVMRDGPPRIF